MMVVLPEPLYPTIKVNGVYKVTLSRWSGAKDLMPWTVNPSMRDIVSQEDDAVPLQYG